MLKLRVSVVVLASLGPVRGMEVPDEIEACFQEAGLSWTEHAPATYEECLEHCTTMCGTCKAVTVAHAAAIFGSMPAPAGGHGAMLDCMCEQKEALARTAVEGDGGMAIMMGCSGAAVSALQAEATANALGLGPSARALPDHAAAPATATTGGLLALGLLLAVVVAFVAKAAFHPVAAFRRPGSTAAKTAVREAPARDRRSEQRVALADPVPLL